MSTDKNVFKDELGHDIASFDVVGTIDATMELITPQDDTGALVYILSNRRGPYMTAEYRTPLDACNGAHLRYGSDIEFVSFRTGELLVVRRTR